MPVLQPDRVSVWKGALPTRAHPHGSLQPKQALRSISLEGCCCPVNFKVAIETDVKHPRVLWQASRPLKILSSPTSGNVCCSWRWSQSAPHPNWASGESTVSKNCSQRPYLSLHYQNKNISAPPKYPANEKLSYSAQLDHPDDLEVNFPVLSYISHQIKGLDYLNICLNNAPVVIPQDSQIVFALINLQGINAWVPVDGNIGKQGEKLPFPAAGPSTS